MSDDTQSGKEELSNRVREIGSFKSRIDILNTTYFTEVLDTLVNNKRLLIKTHPTKASHLLFFYPLPYQKLDLLNSALESHPSYRSVNLTWLNPTYCNSDG